MPIETALDVVAIFLIAGPLLGVLALLVAVAAVWSRPAGRLSATAVGTADQIVCRSRRRGLP